MSRSGIVTFRIDDTPPSLNSWLSKHWRQRDRDKKRWSDLINAECHRAGLPKCDRIDARVTMRFADRRKRDHDNFVSTLSKCLGDALRPDFIPDDDSSRFQVVYGGITSEVGPKYTVVTLEWHRDSLRAVA